MEHDPSPSEKFPIPYRAELESRMQAKIITCNDRGIEKPGGHCACCGGGPVLTPTWRAEPWLIYKAGLCDSDGVYMSMLCEGCLEEIRHANASRPESMRDILAREITHLLEDDIDGAQTMMDDFENLPDDME